MFKKTKTALNGLIDLIYPPICILCRKPAGPRPATGGRQKGHVSSSKKKNQLCEACQATIPENRPPFCCKCSRPLKDSQDSFCQICQRTSFYFDSAWGICLYNGTTRRLIHLFKYGNKTVLRYHFAERISSFIKTYSVDLKHIDVVVPVPLHPARLRERGFNQSCLIARLISEEFHIPRSVNNLRRIRNTRNQAVLSPKERWTNIQGAFRIQHSGIFYEKNVLIIDDLYTTGATVSEAAKVLKEAGAGEVTVLTLAITT